MHRFQKWLRQLDAIQPERTAVWLTVVFCIKGLLFVYFAFQFQQHWPKHLLVNNWAVLSGDSRSYFEPVNAWLNGNGYSGACRMPGILPVYAPLAWLLGESAAKVVLVFIQWAFASLAIYLFALAMFRFSQSKRVFYAVLFVLASSTFVGIWDHYLYMESLAVSSLLCASYWLERMWSGKSKNAAFLMGVFLAWAIFLRPVLIMFVPLLAGIFIVHRTSLQQKIKWMVLVFLPLVIALSAWNVRNYTQFGRVIVMQDEFDRCYAQMKTHHLHLRDLVIAWGGDFQEWSAGTEFAYFLQKKEAPTYRFPDHVYSSVCNVDSLVELRRNYQLSLIDSPERMQAVAKVSASAIRFRDAYIQEKPIRFYLINRLELLRKFIAGGRVDNLPLAAKENMSIDQWAMKLFSTALFMGVMLFGAASAILLSFRKKSMLWWLAGIPLSTIVLLGPVLGFIEQRYLVPVYPFLVACIALCLHFYWPKQKSA
jgi:hypothetical protein